MSGDRSKSGKLSGNQFKLKREARKEKETELLKKVPKTSSFFSGTKSGEKENVTKQLFVDRNASLGVGTSSCSSTDENEQDTEVVTIAEVSATKAEREGEPEKFTPVFPKNSKPSVCFSSEPALWKLSDELRN